MLQNYNTARFEVSEVVQDPEPNTLDVHFQKAKGAKCKNHEKDSYTQ